MSSVKVVKSGLKLDHLYPRSAKRQASSAKDVTSSSPTFHFNDRRKPTKSRQSDSGRDHGSGWGTALGSLGLHVKTRSAKFHFHPWKKAMTASLFCTSSSWRSLNFSGGRGISHSIPTWNDNLVKNSCLVRIAFKYVCLKFGSTAHSSMAASLAAKSARLLHAILWTLVSWRFAISSVMSSTGIPS